MRFPTFSPECKQVNKDDKSINLVNKVTKDNMYPVCCFKWFTIDPPSDPTLRTNQTWNQPRKTLESGCSTLYVAVTASGPPRQSSIQLLTMPNHPQIDRWALKNMQNSLHKIIFYFISMKVCLSEINQMVIAWKKSRFDIRSSDQTAASEIHIKEIMFFFF